MASGLSSHLKITLRRCMRMGASSRLAVGVLLALALACAGATACEASYGSQAAREWFYDAPWFICLLGLLVVNLVGATFVRWPWRWKQMGFVATHYGIVLLLAGALIGRKFGFETLLRLHTAEAVNETQMVFAKHAPVIVQHYGLPSGIRLSLSLEETGLQVTLQQPSLRSEVFPLSTILGKTIRLQGTPFQIEFQNYWPDFVMAEGHPSSRSEDPRNPALQVHLTGSSSGAEPETEAMMTKTLGAQVRLIRFEAPAEEGTHLPADFRSTVCFADPFTGRTTPEAVISMNHPAHYPAGFWRTALGLNTQFSQTQWNPRDLGETTLQVRRDPGWPFKWFGSLLLCVGMIGMFFRSPST